MSVEPVHPSGKCAESKCAGCPSKGSCKSSEPTEQTLKIAQSLQKFSKVYLVLSGKGGVGKSTVATQLAFYLSDRCNKKVGLMDLDICGPSIPTMTSTVGSEVLTSDIGLIPVNVTPNLQTISVGFMLNKTDDAVIMRGPKKHGLIAQFLSEVDWDLNADEYDNNILIIDTPPGTSDEHLSVTSLIKDCAALLAKKYDTHILTQAIIVSTPQEVAISDVRKEIDFCNKIDLPICGVIENMSGFVCPNCNNETQIFFPSKGGVKKLCDDFNIKFLGRIPLDPKLTRCGEEGIPWSSLDDDESIGMEMFVDIVAGVLHLEK
ncbi:Nucleotide-binding_protein 1 [Hexamita inflata]|uniref:Nucleotide-binding protein 1 n=1 Tax=Hexamita inflata TaxID=28002 RepID=A0AA86R558_9EUKA|nr:Nucleotide-binding protein 1 [Hexamita inflata]